MVDTTQARERAQAALERAEKATPGPWHLVEESGRMFIYAGPLSGKADTTAIVELLHGHDNDYECDDDLDNQSFLVMAPQDIPQLANDLLQVLDENERLINVIVALESQIANDDVEVTGRDNVTRVIPQRGDQE